MPDMTRLPSRGRRTADFVVWWAGGFRFGLPIVAGERQPVILTVVDEVRCLHDDSQD